MCWSSIGFVLRRRGTEKRFADGFGSESDSGRGHRPAGRGRGIDPEYAELGCRPLPAQRGAQASLWSCSISSRSLRNAVRPATPVMASFRMNSGVPMSPSVQKLM